MPKFITTYDGRGSGVFFSETKDQAINSVYETMKASGRTPDRRLIKAWPVRSKLKSKPHYHESKPIQKLPTQGRLFS